MAGPWEKYQPAASSDSEDGPWAKFASPESSAEKPSKATSAIRGAAQGLSLGFGDEIQGLMEAGGQAVGIKGLGANDFSSQEFQAPKLSWDELKAAYTQARDAGRAADKEAKEANPMTYFAGELVGGAAGAKTLPGANASTWKSAIGTGAKYGAASGLGNSEAKTIAGMAADTAFGAGIGAAGGGAVYGGVKLIEKAGSLKRAAGEKLKDLAEKTAVNATGATGKESAKFADDAGRELLDRKIVRFGDSQEKIAERAGQAVKSAEEKISTSLQKLEDAGVKVDQNDIFNSVQKRINELKGDPSNADIVSGLEKELLNIVQATEGKSSSSVGVQMAEQIKRGYNRKAGNWMDPEKGQIGKELYQAYRSGVENAAEAADPAIAKTFAEGKKAYGLMAPIREAAERRAATTNQSPAGGLLDIGAMISGFQTAGGPGAVAAPVGRRFIAPRIASSVATTADAISKRLLQTAEGTALAKSDPGKFRSIVLNLTEQAQQRLDGAPGKVADSFQKDNIPERDGPTKGPQKWARTGEEKLAQHSPDIQLTDEQKNDPKIRNLLIAASDLKPGSKAMNAVASKIAARIGGE